MAVIIALDDKDLLNVDQLLRMTIVENGDEIRAELFTHSGFEVILTGEKARMFIKGLERLLNPSPSVVAVPQFAVRKGPHGAN